MVLIEEICSIGFSSIASVSSILFLVEPKRTGYISREKSQNLIDQVNIMIDLFVCRVLLLSLTLFQLFCGGQLTYPFLPGISFSSALRNKFSEPLSACLYTCCINIDQQWEMNESLYNDLLSIHG